MFVTSSQLFSQTFSKCPPKWRRDPPDPIQCWSENYWFSHRETPTRANVELSVDTSSMCRACNIVWGLGVHRMRAHNSQKTSLFNKPVRSNVRGFARFCWRSDRNFIENVQNMLKNAISAFKNDHRAEDDLCQHCMGSGEKVNVHFVSPIAYCPFSCRMKYENISKQILDLFWKYFWKYF